ncbi:protocadherin 4 fat, partial [Mytilus galloprovincialis]
LTYTIQSTTGAQQYFTVTPSGAIVAIRSLTEDGANTNPYLMTITLRDQGNPVLTAITQATVRINVNRNINCPVFNTNSPSTYTITQSQTTLVFATVSATDADAINTPFSSITYSIIGDDGATSMFTLNTNTGGISNLPALYSDNGRTYQLRIQATDGGTPACSTTRVILVTVERNLNAPQWSGTNTPNNYVVEILETHDVTIPVKVLAATDADDRSPNRDIIYEFDPNSQHQDLFTVDQNGPVYLRGSMIGKTPIQYVLTLFARDKGTSQKSSPVGTLTVNVVRNQNAPIINNLPREVNISAGQGTNLEIFRVTATDADTRSPYNTLTFDRTGEGSATTYFNVNPSNGAVFLTASVSGVPDERFYLRVRAQDGGDPKKFDSKVLTIIVNRNLQKPVMSAGQYNKRILETQAVSVELVKVLATDGDNFVTSFKNSVDNIKAPNNQLEYFISSNNAEVNKFVQVDADTGSVSLKQSIKNFTNAATVFTVSFQVSARDKAASPQTADNPQIVQLTVVRNTRPMFTNPAAYSNAIPETTPGGQIVYATTVSNTDTDAPFNQLDYSLYPDSTNLARLFFEIDSSGVVRVRTGVNLNQTAQTQFDVRVVVADR